jgi:ABC-type multidrug transport system ATPase subunit
LTNALEVQDLSFGYGRRESVHAVSLSLRPGDCYGFLGHNGAGKTTVLRLCLGLLRPQRGHIRVHGIDAAAAPRLARAQIGALVERPGFHQSISARQNLVWIARLLGLPRVRAAAEAARALEATGLAGVAERRVGTFSLGMRQRLGIAQALLGSPRLLLLDEPTNGLDPEGIADLRDLLRRLVREDGLAILLSSHQLQELEGLCNRIGVLQQGRMVIEGEVETLRRRLQARHLIGGPALTAVADHLRQLGLAPEPDGKQLRVDLQQLRPGEVLRSLTPQHDIELFSPEAVSLEAIYRHAGTLAAAASAPTGGQQAQAAVAAPTAQATATPPRVAMQGGDARSASLPLWRAFGHELRTLVGRRGTAGLLAVPAIAAAYSTWGYAGKVQAQLARVQGGELFSADGGSGQLAAAQALQAAQPVLALCVLWLASQNVAADFSRDTLRNTLMRSVSRLDVLVGKFGALALLTMVGWLLTCAAALFGAAWTMGMGDLEEISRNGDRQVLAHGADVAPVLYRSLLHGILPLLGVVSVGLFASIAARRPARALGLALLLGAGSEVLRGRLGDHAGWLLSSHLPTGLRDDSALGYLAAVARGAADAHWQFAEYALAAPCAWILAGLLLGGWRFLRLRIA